MQENNVTTSDVSNKNNNTILYVVIIILVIAILGLVGFIIYDKTQNNKESENSNTVDQSNSNKEEDTTYDINKLASKVDESKDWVYDAEYEKKVSAKSYKTYSNTYYAKDIVVPYININSLDAEEANTSIKKVFDDAIKTYNSGVKDKMTYIKDCNYKKYSNGNALSVILTYGVGATAVVHPNYYVYNFDLKTGNKLTYEEIYSISGFTSDNIESKVTTAITDKMKEELADFSEGKSDKEFNKYNTASINNYKKSVTNGKLRYFLADNNKLNVIVTLSIPADSGEFDTIITVE